MSPCPPVVGTPSPRRVVTRSQKNNTYNTERIPQQCPSQSRFMPRLHSKKIYDMAFEIPNATGQAKDRPVQFRFIAKRD